MSRFWTCCPTNVERTVISEGGTTMNPTTNLADLGNDIAEQGIARFEDQIADLATTARTHRVAPHAVDAMVDPSAPTVVRERAFAVVAVALAASRPAPRESEIAA
jgi:hypothetical protein